MTFSRFLLSATIFVAVLSLPESTGPEAPEPTADARMTEKTAPASETGGTQLQSRAEMPTESGSRLSPWRLAGLLILLGAVGAKRLLKRRKVAQNSRCAQSLTREFRAAVKLMLDNQLEAALDKFNIIETGGLDRGLSEKRFPHGQVSLETVRKHRQDLQDKIFNRLTGDIDKVGVGAANSGSSEWAETLCFQLERLQGKFNDEYRQKAKSYLRERAPEVLAQVWAYRAHRFKSLSHPSDIGEAVQTCLHYIIEHRPSEFLPLKLVETQVSRLVSRWARVHLRPGGEPGACQSYLNAEKLRGLCEQEGLSRLVLSGLEAACEKLRVACQVEQILTTGDSGARLDALNMLNDLYDPLQACARDRMLQRRILDCFDRTLVAQDTKTVTAQHDPYFNRIIHEIQEKLLRKLVDAASKLSDENMASTYRAHLERLTADDRTQRAAAGKR